MSGRIRGIVFDLDGVLIHSTGCHRAAFEEVLAPLGIADFDYSRYAGWRTADVIAAEFRRCALPADDAAIAAAARNKTRIARKNLIETNPVAEGCKDVLSGLATHYRLALASSGSHGTVHAFLEGNGFGKFFTSVLTGADVIHAKPHPEIYERSFEALELKPRACLVVEDAVSGIEAARRAHADAIGVEGTSTAALLLEAGALRVVSRLTEIASLAASL